MKAASPGIPNPISARRIRQVAFAYDLTFAPPVSFPGWLLIDDALHGAPSAAFSCSLPVPLISITCSSPRDHSFQNSFICTSFEIRFPLRLRVGPKTVAKKRTTSPLPDEQMSCRERICNRPIKCPFVLVSFALRTFLWVRSEGLSNSRN